MAIRFRVCVATAVFLLAIVSTATAKYSGGSGTADDPYQIATAADLIALGETPDDYDKHFLLTADIDLDPKLPGRKVFDKAVIARDTNDTELWFQGTAFTGVFDGNGHTISHLTIRGKDCLGLVGQLGKNYGVYGGDIRDLGVVDVNIIGSGGLVGALVGWNYGTVTHCYSTGVVSGVVAVGGLTGGNNGRLTQCYSTGAVNATGQYAHAGGLAGTNDGTVVQCCSTGAVSGTESVGGLVGSTDIGSFGGRLGPLPSVTRCYSTGAVSGTESVGGLVGSGWPDDVTTCFWDTQTSGQVKSAGGTGKTTAQMHDPNTFRASGWDFVGQADGPHDIWAEPKGGGYPILWWQQSPLPSLPRFSGGTGEPNDPYTISTAKDLNSIGHNPRLMKCHFKLVSDLDLTGIRFYPIGDYYDDPYGGVFDGNGHTISHLTIKGESCVGLFGVLASGAEVKNLGVVDVNITSYGGVIGGVVGCNNGGTVTNCYSTGAVKGDGDVGGLVGWNWGTVTQCYSTGAVSGKKVIGGLIGNGPASNATACFWDTQTSGQTTSAGGTGKTTAEMQTASTFLNAGWDFVGETKNGTEDIWWILEGRDYPKLWWELTEKKSVVTAGE